MPAGIHYISVPPLSQVRGMQQPREPEEITTLPPYPFSFWVASLLDNPQEQQAVSEASSLQSIDFFSL